MSLTNTKLENYIESQYTKVENDYADTSRSIREVSDYMQVQTSANTQLSEETKAAILERGATNQQFYTTSINGTTQTASSVETFDIQLNPNTSTKTAITMITAFAGFQHVPTETAGNVIAEQMDFNVKAKEAERALGTKYVADVLSFLNTNKTQTWDVSQIMTSGSITFDAGRDALQVNQAALKDNFLTQLDIMFAAQDFDDEGLIALSSKGFLSVLGEIAKYGENNDKNLQAQMQGLGLDYYLTNKIVPTGLFDAYVSRRGSVAQVNALTPAAIRGLVGGDTKFYTVNQPMPILGAIPLSVFEITGKTDNTVNSFYKDLTISTGYGMIMKYGFVTDYIADRSTTASDILMIEGLSS